MDALARRFQSVLSKRSQLSIGVSRHQLVVDGAATDESNASLVDLAERLYEHELGIVTVLATVQRSTLDEFIGAIAVSPARGSAPFGAGGRSQLARWNDLVLTRVAFDRLELMDEGSEAERDDPKTKRSTELWLGLTRAALAGESLDGALEDPARLAESVTRQVNEDGSDAAILGILRQIIGELDDVEIRDSPLRQRVSDLVRNLDDATLSKLLDMSQNDDAETRSNGSPTTRRNPGSAAHWVWLVNVRPGLQRGSAFHGTWLWRSTKPGRMIPSVAIVIALGMSGGLSDTDAIRPFATPT